MSTFNHRQERVEIYLDGGKPWGFAIKGGLESNKALKISKVSCFQLNKIFCLTFLLYNL